MGTRSPDPMERLVLSVSRTGVPRMNVFLSPFLLYYLFFCLSMDVSVVLGSVFPLFFGRDLWRRRPLVRGTLFHYSFHRKLN